MIISFHWVPLSSDVCRGTLKKWLFDVESTICNLRYLWLSLHNHMSLPCCNTLMYLWRTMEGITVIILFHWVPLSGDGCGGTLKWSFVLSQIVTGLKISPDPCFTTIFMYELTVLAGFVSTRELITKSSCLLTRLFTTKLHLTSRTWSKSMLSVDVFDLAAQHYSLSQELTVWLLETVHFQVMLLKFGINCRRTSKTVSLKHLRCSWKATSFRKRNFLCPLAPLNISLMILALSDIDWLIDW